MTRALIDTSVISECSRQNITPQKLRSILTGKNLTPVVGIYTTYEIARPIITDKPSIATQLYSFIRDLKPEFSCQTHELYIREAKKLKTDESVNDEPTNQYKILLQKRIEDYCNDKWDQTHEDFIRIRQAELTASRQAWQPIKIGGKFRKYKNNFNQFIVDCWSTFAFNPTQIEWIRATVRMATWNTISLTDKEITKFIHNRIAYPALRSLIYRQIYLQFLAGTHQDTPAEDRFTDTLLMIEGSYCAAIISNDKAFMRNHAKNINPYIETIYLEDLLNTIPT